MDILIIQALEAKSATRIISTSGVGKVKFTSEVDQQTGVNLTENTTFPGLILDNRLN